MRVLIASRHRYPAFPEQGCGHGVRGRPSDAPGHVHDLLARGLAERGHEVDYLLPAGSEVPLPEGVRPVNRPGRFDVSHNIRVDGRPWVVTVHAERPAIAYLDLFAGGGVVPATSNGNGRVHSLPPEAICVSAALARGLGGERFVHNGLDPADYSFSETKGDYFLFMAGMQGPRLGVTHQAKGLDVALGLVRSCGIELVVAGTASERRVAREVSRLCRDAGARYVGDVRGAAKAELLAGARALLFPTRLEEGFGLVIAEALLSGTPVIASDRGACRELIDDEVGIVCGSESEFAEAIERVHELSPSACRAKALRDFDYRRMVDDYLSEYRRELGGD